MSDKEELKSAEAFAEAIFEKRSVLIGKFYVRYDHNKNISYGFWFRHRTPIITIYWDKNRVVLSYNGIKSLFAFDLLDSLLPSTVILRKKENKWVLDTGDSEFEWMDSQVFSLEQYNLYDSPYGVIGIDDTGHVDVKIALPVEVVTVQGERISGKVMMYRVEIWKLKKDWCEGHHTFHTIVNWRYKKLISKVTTKKQAELIAQQYSIAHRIPYVKHLQSTTQMDVRYHFNPGQYY